MDERVKERVWAQVRQEYAGAARGESGGCRPGCCGGNGADASRKIGYSEEELTAAPDGANLGLGCGNPQAVAALRLGETVLDAGAGAGFDCFLAARQVGPTGRVIGVDMVVEMLTNARANAAKVGATNVEFRLGEIERLPVADGVIDVVLSNCVVNLSPDKEAVFREVFRVLKPGGRLAIADVVAIEPIPSSMLDHPRARASCVAGAVSAEELNELLAAAGFEAIRISVRNDSHTFIRDWLPGSGAENVLASASIEAVKPMTKTCCGPACCAPAESA